ASPPTMLVLTIYILIFTVGFPANVFTFITLLRKARRRLSPSDLLLLNLTGADLLLLLFLPFKMAEAAAAMTWPLPIVLCPVANFCFYSSIYLSSLFLAALSVERYLGVVFPHQYKDRRRLGRTLVASVVLWLLACSHCSIVFVAHYLGGTTQDVHHDSNSTPKCYDDFSTTQLRFVLPLRLELFLVLFLLPFAITIFCYVTLVKVLLSRPNISKEKKQRAVGLAVATMVNFGVCFAPYNLSHLVGFVENQSPPWRVYALLLSSFNAALDPLVFYFSSTAVQRAVAGVVVALR
ncbi:FFAR2 protein, partial [Aegotheles bennettii]|nr:FFAR2 protein [Aegotheles bennettii]